MLKLYKQGCLLALISPYVDCYVLPSMESDMTEWLNWTELIQRSHYSSHCLGKLGITLIPSLLCLRLSQVPLMRYSPRSWTWNQGHSWCSFVYPWKSGFTPSYLDQKVISTEEKSHALDGGLGGGRCFRSVCVLLGGKSVRIHPVLSWVVSPTKKDILKS